tara:strand:- start:607 stop:783 length:177 start_codon:yes stop_codon:yes gene_type:complete
MVIENAKYNKNTYDNSKNVSINATINGIIWSVPLDENNVHYKAILEWVADGNTIEEAD